MIRSLFGVLIAVLIGLTTAKFIEGMGAVSFPLLDAGAGDLEALKAAAAKAPVGYKLVLLASWAIAAFVSAIIALFISRKWAPIGWLAAGTIFFLAVMTLVGTPFGLWLWPASAIVTATGGWIAIKLLKATYVYPEKKDDNGFLS